MADLIRKMQEGHTVEDLDTVIDEVYEARGEYDSLDERLDDMEGGAPTPSTSIPAMDGTGSAGTADTYARGDHTHPTDTSRHPTIDSSHKLSADLVDDTSATHKFATAAQLEQIETNKNNISKDKAVLVELVDAGAKNLLDIQTAVGSNGGLISIVENTITITGNAAWAQGQFEMRIEKDGLYYLAFDVDSPVSTGLIAVSINGNMIASYPAISAITDKTISFHGIANDNLTIRLLVNNTSSALEQPESLVISNIMLCTAEDYAISSEFVPYAMTNAELTAAIQAIQAQLANQ